MQVSFTAQQVDFNRYKLGNHDVDRIPRMTDEQVVLVNSTRKMPSDYFVMTKETNYYNKNKNNRTSDVKLSLVNPKQPVITVIKGAKDFPIADNPNYYDELPEGFEIENTFLGTYMKKSSVEHPLLNRFQAPIYVVLGAGLCLLFNKLFRVLK